MKKHKLDPLHQELLSMRKKLARRMGSRFLKNVKGLAPSKHNYRDYRYSCRDCGKLTIWPAEFQRIFYEHWRKPRERVPVRCGECQYLLRQKINENNRRTAEGLLKKPDSPRHNAFPKNMKHLLPDTAPSAPLR